MNVGFRASGVIFFMWAMLAMVTAIVELQDSPSDVAGSASSFQSFVNTVGNPQEVGLTDPVVGFQATNPVSAVLQIGTLAGSWFKFLTQSFLLQSSIWEGWTAPIRYGIMVMSAPFLLSITLTLTQMFANFFGGIFGRATG